MSVTHARPAVVLLLVLTAIGISVPLRAQSLAEVAKKEEERRKALPSQAKVYTNKDLTAPPAGTPPAPSGAAATQSLADAARSAADGDKAAKDTEGKGSEPKNQAYWAGRRKVLQDKLDRDESFLQALQTRINSLSADVVNRDDPAQRAVLERERLKAVADLGRLQQEIVGGKKALADLEEEARRAGVPAGWLR
jgi:hypothetical protein